MGVAVRSEGRFVHPLRLPNRLPAVSRIKQGWVERPKPPPPASKAHAGSEGGRSNLSSSIVAQKQGQMSQKQEHMADGQKVLVHALLCGEGKCARSDCDHKVEKVKQALRRLETHAAECKVRSNLP